MVCLLRTPHNFLIGTVLERSGAELIFWEKNNKGWQLSGAKQVYNTLRIKVKQN